MISFDYAARHVRGMWRLALGDDDWRDDMDLTTDGVFASFWAIAFSIPFEILGGMAEARIAASTPAYSSSLYASVPIAVMLATQIIASLIAWGVTIAALVLAAQRLGASRETAGLIISYNWSQLLAYFSVMAPAAAITATGSAELSALLFLGVLFFSIYLFWVVIRRNLPVDIGVTVLLIVALSAVSIGVYTVLTNIAVRLFGRSEIAILWIQ